MTLLVLHLLVYAGFVYLTLTKAFTTLRNMGVFKCCGLMPTNIVKMPSSSSDTNSFDLEMQSTSSPVMVPASPMVAMTLLSDDVRGD
jgi:hypothetical protein